MSKRLSVSLCALILGVLSLPVGIAMANGWNPYDLAPFFQRIQAGLSCCAGAIGLGIAVGVAIDSAIGHFTRKGNK